MTQRRVLLYELNEVPWAVVDRYVATRPRSALARLLGTAMQLTTTSAEPFELMPWRTWPTFHTSLFTKDHNAYDQGQDPATFRGTPLWDVVADAGLRVGLFGALQTWPPRPFPAGGFYVPDSFAPDPDTVPASLRRFQSFNTTMTNENSFASTERLGAAMLLAVGIDLAGKGLMPWSVVRGLEQVVRERFDGRYACRRPAAQVIPCFDVFWRLHRRHDPHLSVFFTNHVASMMHRFWGDWFSDYGEAQGYEPDPVYGRFIVSAMDLFDHGLARILRWVDRTPAAMLVLASSMGQGPIPYHSMARTYVVEDAGRLIAALGLPAAQVGVAMYPRVTLIFADETQAHAAVEPVESAGVPAGPLFRDTRVEGRTLSFEIRYENDAVALSRNVRWKPLGMAETTGDVARLGVAVRDRPGGGNTAQHVPDGIFLAYGGPARPDPSRRKVSILDAAPSILTLFGLDAAPSMQGRATIFSDVAAVDAI